MLANFDTGDNAAHFGQTLRIFGGHYEISENAQLMRRAPTTSGPCADQFRSTSTSRDLQSRPESLKGAVSRLLHGKVTRVVTRNCIDAAVGKGSNFRVRADQPEKGLIMSHRTIISLAASVIVGIACIATISTDAFAYRRGVGVGRAGVYHGGVYRGAAVRRGVAVGVGAAAVGAGAYGAYRCGYYPYRPC